MQKLKKTIGEKEFEYIYYRPSPEDGAPSPMSPLMIFKVLPEPGSVAQRQGHVSGRGCMEGWSSISNQGVADKSDKVSPACTRSRFSTSLSFRDIVSPKHCQQVRCCHACPPPQALYIGKLSSTHQKATTTTLKCKIMPNVYTQHIFFLQRSGRTHTRV